MARADNAQRLTVRDPASVRHLDPLNAVKVRPVMDSGSRPCRSGTGRHDGTSVLAGAGPHVDDVVGCTNHLLVVLNHDERVSEISEALQRPDEPQIVALVKTDARLIKDVDPRRGPNRFASRAVYAEASPPESVSLARSSVK